MDALKHVNFRQRYDADLGYISCFLLRKYAFSPRSLKIVF